VLFRSGGFVFGLNTTDGVGPSLSHFFGDAFGGSGGLWRTEGTIAGYQQNAFEGYYGLSDAGGIAYSPSTDAIGGASGLDSVWLNDTPIAVEEDAIPDSANFVSFGSRPTVSYNGGLWWIGGETDTQGGSTDVRGLYAGSVDNPIVRQGDAVAGFASPVDGIDFDFAISGNGSNWIDLLMFNTGSSGDDGGVVLNGAALMAGGSVVQESVAVPASVGGLAGERWGNFDFFAVDNDNNYFVTGDTDADSSVDEFIMHNGQIILREGDSISTVTRGTSTISGAIEDFAANESGDWLAVWDVDTGAGNVEALIVNGSVLLLEGDAIDWTGDGVIDGADNNGVIANFTGLAAVAEISERRPNGSFEIFFTADIDFNGTSSSIDDLEGGFRILIPSPGVAGLFGIAGLAGLRRRRC